MDIQEHEYIIVGGGPGGLQLGYVFEKNNIDYVILEKGETVCKFFKDYPLYRKLISINKKYTGTDDKEFNLRHDWNSLLNDEGLLFTDYSDNFYPQADTFVKYCEDFSKKFKLKIKYNTEVTNIKKEESHPPFNSPSGAYEISTNKEEYRGKYIIIATGIWKPNIPKLIKNTKYCETYYIGKNRISRDINKYRNKNILIIGNGNSGLSCASKLIGITKRTHVVSRGILKMAWKTHYPGDVRSRNTDFIDTYLLKSLGGLVEYDSKLFEKVEHFHQLQLIAL